MSNSPHSTNNTIQAAWVALGGLFSIGFAIVSAMILSRYLSKEEYGLYKQVLYVYTTLNGLFVLGLPKAFSYFLPKSPDDEAKSLINKITKLFFILGGCFSILLFGGSGIISEALNTPQLKPLLKIFAPVPLLMMPTLGLEGILATYRKTKFITVYTIATRLGMLICVCMPIIVFNLNVEAALIGFVISSLISFFLALYLKYYPVKEYGNKPTSETYKSIFRFCFPLFIASIWGTLINSTDQFFISRYFGNKVFADFSNGAMELPFVGIIISSTSTVLTPLFTRKLYHGANISEQILPIWRSVVAKSAMLIYPLTVFCFFDADSIMIAMYGEQYLVSGDFFRIKLFTYFFNIVIFYSLIIALGATKFYQNLHLIIFLLLASTEYLSIKIFPNPLFITAIHVFYTIIKCMAMWLYVSKALKINLITLIPIKIISLVLIASILSCGIINISRYYIYPDLNTISTLSIDLCLMLIIYFIISLIFRLDYMNIIKPLLKKV